MDMLYLGGESGHGGGDWNSNSAEGNEDGGGAGAGAAPQKTEAVLRAILSAIGEIAADEVGRCTFT